MNIIPDPALFNIHCAYTITRYKMSARIGSLPLPLLLSYQIRQVMNGANNPCIFDMLYLFYVCTDNSRDLHHVDRLTYFHSCKVSDLAWFAFSFCVSENREQFSISYNKFACILRLPILSFCLKSFRFKGDSPIGWKKIFYQAPLGQWFWGAFLSQKQILYI